MCFTLHVFILESWLALLESTLTWILLPCPHDISWPVFLSHFVATTCPDPLFYNFLHPLFWRFLHFFLRYPLKICFVRYLHWDVQLVMTPMPSILVCPYIYLLYPMMTEGVKWNPGCLNLPNSPIYTFYIRWWLKGTSGTLDAWIFQTLRSTNRSTLTLLCLLISQITMMVEGDNWNPGWLTPLPLQSTSTSRSLKSEPNSSQPTSRSL